MEDLKTMLDKGMSIADINKAVNQFIDSAEGYKDTDKLKLTFILLNLIQKGATALCTIDVSDFISKIKKKIDEMEQEKETLSKEYEAHLEQNDKIISILSNENNYEISNIQRKIQDLLSDYDGIIKELVKLREKLPIEKQIEKEF